MVAAKLATLKRGANQHSKEHESIAPPSSDDAAGLLSVGPASVKRAKQVIDAGSKEIIEAVEQGDLAVSFAAKVVAKEPDKKTQTNKLLTSGGKAALKEHTAKPGLSVDDEKKGTAVATIKNLWSKWD